MITDSELRTLTLWHHTLMMAERIPVMKTFPEYYREKLGPEQRRLIDRFEADKAAAADEIAEMMESEK